MKYFIITGASKGLGEGLALELLREDHHLLCISRSESEQLRKLAAAKNVSLDFFLYDLANTQGIPALVEDIFKKIDSTQTEGIYLVNNAGLVSPVDRAENCPPEEAEKHLRVNLIAPMLLTSSFIKHVRDWHTEKRVLHISSGAAQNPYYGWSCYCTGKAGLDMFGQCVSEEQKEEKYPVKTMSVAPGIIDTGMQTTIRGSSERAFIHRDKFVSLKETGQLVPPAVAGKKLAGILLSENFKDGAITDIRDSY